MSHDCTAKCVAGWPAGKKCHCTACGETMSCPAHFDKHRDKDSCINPRKLGLTKNDFGVWVQKGEVDEEESSTP
jgi:hypothetical protein